MKPEKPFEIITGGQPGPADLTKSAKQADINSRIHRQGELEPAEKIGLIKDMHHEQLQNIRLGVQAATGILVDAETAEDIYRTTTQLALVDDIPTRRKLLEDLKQRHEGLANYFSRFESVVRSNKLEE